jgi:hypothetical protein
LNNSSLIDGCINIEQAFGNFVCSCRSKLSTCVCGYNIVDFKEVITDLMRYVSLRRVFPKSGGVIP